MLQMFVQEEWPKVQTQQNQGSLLSGTLVWIIYADKEENYILLSLYLSSLALQIFEIIDSAKA